VYSLALTAIIVADISIAVLALVGVFPDGWPLRSAMIVGVAMTLARWSPGSGWM
jgi:hypothetical protein